MNTNDVDDGGVMIKFSELFKAFIDKSKALSDGELSDAVQKAHNESKLLQSFFKTPGVMLKKVKELLGRK